MQLMIYLISAATGDLTPAGMFYFNIKDPIESINDKSENQIASLLAKEAEDEFKLKGAFINEEGVLSAMPEKVLTSAKGAMSREEYEEVRRDVIARIEETAEGILGGKIDIRPLRVDSRLACGYCSYKPVCRRDRGYVKNSYRQIEPKPKEKA
jgi:ATP-dependent helicase/nuclease subunit B